jgi:ribose-phosphate pyrophosphokinase
MTSELMRMRILADPHSEYLATRIYKALGKVLENKVEKYLGLYRLSKKSMQEYRQLTDVCPVELLDKIKDIEKYLSKYGNNYDDLHVMKLDGDESDFQIFRNKEIKPHPVINLRNKDVYAVHMFKDYLGSDEPNIGYMKLFLILDALKRASADNITVVSPYMPYQRQDRKDIKHTPISFKLMMKLLECAGANSLLTIDLHAKQEQGFSDQPMDNLGSPMIFIDWLNNYSALNNNNVTIINPDAGSADRNKGIVRLSGLPFATVDKTRPPGKDAKAQYIFGSENIPGRKCVIIDDLIDGGGTTEETAKMVKSCNPSGIVATATHLVGSPSKRRGKDARAIEHLKDTGLFERVVVTDSNYSDYWKEFEGFLETVSVAPFLAEAIYEIQAGGSVSKMFPEIPKK